MSRADSGRRAIQGDFIEQEGTQPHTQAVVPSRKIVTEFLFHGSRTKGLTELLPRRDTHPHAEPDAPAAVYAGIDAAYCAAHAFPGTSSDGVEIGFESRFENGRLINDPVTLSIPNALAAQLKVPVTLYKLSGASFEPQPHISPVGFNFRSLSAVSVLEEITFPSVTEAVEGLGGRVVIRNM